MRSSNACRATEPADSGSAPRRARILIVDDEPYLARSLCRALSFHHDATALTSGAPAIARIEAGERFDVIVLDLTMPDISGAETYERIRAASQSQADRVLFITGGTFAQSAREFLASQSNRWMGKPCNIQALLGVIGEILAPPDAGPIDSAPPTGR